MQRRQRGQGLRVCDWATVAIRPLGEPDKGCWLLARRSIAKPGELACYVCSGPVGTALEQPAKVAGTRWAIEECFEEAKGQAGLDQYEVRRRDGWYRHITLAMAAHAYLAAVRQQTNECCYTGHVLIHRRPEFPGLVSYNRFVELTPTVIIPLLACLQQRQGNCTGLAFVDATAIKVCHNKRIPRHKVFAGIAARGKTSMGWFLGFKLHLTVNDRGEILACRLTPGNASVA